MTRDEAVYLIHRIHNPEDFQTGMHATFSLPHFNENKDFSAKAIDALVALGVLKLDEPKIFTATDRLKEELNKVYTIHTVTTVLAIIKSAGLKIVEKDK